MSEGKKMLNDKELPSVLNLIIELGGFSLNYVVFVVDGSVPVVNPPRPSEADKPIL